MDRGGLEMDDDVMVGLPLTHYHIHLGCIMAAPNRLDTDAAIEVTVEKAEKEGFGPCSRCVTGPKGPDPEERLNEQ